MVNLNRKTENAYHVPVTDIVIEKGTSILLPVYAIRTDAEYYPDPEQFNPNRFSDAEKQTRHPMTDLPFDDGLRNYCMGERFAMLQNKVGVVGLLTHFEFSISPNTPVPYVIDIASVAIEPKDGIFLQLTPLQQ